MATIPLGRQQNGVVGFEIWSTLIGWESFSGNTIGF